MHQGKFKYSDQEIIDSAKPFRYKVDWLESNPNMYAVARKRGLLKIATAHMASKINSYTKESCQIAALKSKSRFEFKKKSPGEYHSAQYNGWFEDIVKHMPRQAQIIYDTPETILNIIESGNYKHYGDLPLGLISVCPYSRRFGLSSHASPTNEGHFL